MPGVKSYDIKEFAVFMASAFNPFAVPDCNPEITVLIDTKSVRNAVINLKQNLSVGDVSCYKVSVIDKYRMFKRVGKIKLGLIMAPCHSV